jgi:hypothetical protein
VVKEKKGIRLKNLLSNPIRLPLIPTSTKFTLHSSYPKDFVGCNGAKGKRVGLQRKDIKALGLC